MTVDLGRWWWELGAVVAGSGEAGDDGARGRAAAARRRLASPCALPPGSHTHHASTRRSCIRPSQLQPFHAIQLFSRSPIGKGKPLSQLGRLMRQVQHCIVQLLLFAIWFLICSVWMDFNGSKQALVWQNRCIVM